MMKEIQNLNILMRGITINGPMFDIHDNGVVKNYFATPSDSSMNASEDGIKSALLALLETTDEEDRQLFTEKGQWYAVYKVLSECHGYPTNIREFCDIMKNWGMDKMSPACTYNSVRKIPSDIPKSTAKVTLWNNYKDKADEKFKKQILVANKLMEMLEEYPPFSKSFSFSQYHSQFKPPGLSWEFFYVLCTVGSKQAVPAVLFDMLIQTKNDTPLKRGEN